tara:strand:+ start:6778 stop:7077 length:300 start_codon:yes stop_codon:yes gene_type:complete
MSTDIDELKKLTDELTDSFKRKITLESQRLEKNNYLILALLIVFLGSTILFSLILKHSIINPIRHITNALNKMAQGDKNIQFKETLGSDEISEMQLAYS